VDWDGYSGVIPKTSATLPEALRYYGYKTAAIGKWHNTEQRAALELFNAAFRAEESGLRQAHEIAGRGRIVRPRARRGASSVRRRRGLAP
jgi:arylsulfatase A-like enzyme